MSTKETVSSLHAEIVVNADAYYDDDLSYDEFTRRQRDAWARIRQAGRAVEAQVLALIRGEPGRPSCGEAHEEDTHTAGRVSASERIETSRSATAAVAAGRQAASSSQSATNRRRSTRER